ncbi:MAG: replication initiation protein [Helicobacteraceae bacterium]|nr:replication initiation protein [Helicobacteraceae bacterium]
MPSASVQITRGNFPLLQQKIFASLIYAVTTKIARRPKLNNSEPDEMTIFHWCVNLKQLRELSEFNSNDYSLFKRSIDALVDLSVSFNLLGKDKDDIVICSECGTYMSELNNRLVCPSCGHTTEKKTRAAVKAISGKSNIIDAVIYKDDKLYFSFTNLVNYYLDKAQTRLYCKFLPKKLNSLKHGSSHAIYLLLLDYIDEKRGRGQTPFIDIVTFAKLVGGDKYLSNFKNLRTFVIDKAIDEINSKTNIDAFFDKYDDVKLNGRRVIAVRIRGRYKQSKPIQTTLFDDNANNANNGLNNSKSNEITLFNQTINKESFLDFLAKDATNKSAYKVHLRQLLDNGKLGDKEARVNQYIAYKREQEIKSEQEEKQRKANELYKTLDAIAVKEKGSSLENLYLSTQDEGFLSFSSIIGNNRLLELCSSLINSSQETMLKRLATHKEKQTKETEERERYERLIVQSLTNISPSENWQVILDGAKSNVFFSNRIQGITKEKAPLPLLRKIYIALSIGKKIEFEIDNSKYIGSLDKEMALVLTDAITDTTTAKD